jgi:hypothetical protein
MTEFLSSLLTESYPETHAETAPECEWCGEPHEGLIEVDDSDPSVGYYRTLWICANCQTKRRIERNRGY